MFCLRNHGDIHARKEQNKSFRKDEKQFYSKLGRVELQDKEIEIPQVEDMADYW